MLTKNCSLPSDLLVPCCCASADASANPWRGETFTRFPSTACRSTASRSSCPPPASPSTGRRSTGPSIVPSDGGTILTGCTRTPTPGKARRDMLAPISLGSPAKHQR
jgi:hypothetical protein